MKCDYCQSIGHTIEMCYELKGYPLGYKKKTSNQFQNRNVSNNSFVDQSVSYTSQPSTSSSVSASTSAPLSSINEQMLKIMNLIFEKPSPMGIHANMAGKILNNNVFYNFNFDTFFKSNNVGSTNGLNIGWIIDSRANQHITVFDKNMFNIVDITDLKITVSHPNGTKAKVKKIGNLKISNCVTLFDVLIVPEYCVSLLSVNKLARDNKLFICFNESMLYSGLEANENFGDR